MRSPSRYWRNKDYDDQNLRQLAREYDVLPLNKHRGFHPIDNAHNARVDRALYGQKARYETIFSVTKRTLGDVGRGWNW